MMENSMLIKDNLYFSLSTQDMGKTHRHEKKVKCQLFFNEEILVTFLSFVCPFFTAKIFCSTIQYINHA